MIEDAVNEFVVKESGISITITVTVSGEGSGHNDRGRVEWYGEELSNKMFIKCAKKYGPRRVKLTKVHDRHL